MNRIRVAGIVPLKNGFAFMHRKDVIKRKDFQDYYTFPGGGLEEGETLEEGTIREIKEELNADIEISEYIGEIRHHYPEKDIKLIFYKAKLLSQKIELLEHESCKWITKDERDKFEFAGADKTVFDLI